MKLIWVLIAAGFFLSGCSFLGKKTESSSREIIKTSDSESMKASECFQPRFSSRGDQILYLCQQGKASPQIFIEDLNTQLVKQITFQAGDISSAHFLRPDTLIYLSTNDTAKESIEFLINSAPHMPTFEIYKLSLNEDEISRVTENNQQELTLTPIKNLDPKIAFTRSDAGKTHVFLKNLKNNSEKMIYSTRFPVTELVPGDAHQVLIVEDLGDRKWARLIENEVKQSVWPEIKGSVQNFTLNPNTGDIEYLEITPESAKLKLLSTKNMCFSEIFTFPKGTLDAQKSPVSDQLYVITRQEQGLRQIEKKVISRDPSASCKKIVKRR